MEKNSIPRCEVILCISDATISPQLLEVIKCFKANNVDQHILIMATEFNPLLESIRLLGVSFEVLPLVSKFGLGKTALAILFRLLRNRPNTFISSGQFATLSGIPAAFFLQIRQRIYIRHHSNYHHKYRMHLALMFDRMMNRLSTDIVAVSRVVQSILIEKENVPRDKICVIYNGIDLERFAPGDRKVTTDTRDFRIGVISRLTEWKGVEFTAEAFRELNSINSNSFLHIIGASSDSSPAVLRILKKVPTEKYLIEPFNLDIPEFLKSIDVLVHVPLAPDDEAFGIVYLEALASGTPCIFTISGVLNELPNPERYFSIVPPGDSSEILVKLEEFYSQSMNHEHVSSEWLEQFSLANQGRSYLRLLSA